MEEGRMVGRVLLAVGDPQVRRRLVGQLRARGFAVAVAHDGEQLLEQLTAALLGEGARPDLVLADQELPQGARLETPPGEELLRGLRQVGWLQPLILSASGDDPGFHALTRRVRELEGTVLGRPCRSEDLADHLERVLTGARRRGTRAGDGCFRSRTS